jgi:tetratricopeptide (TPR) repeat protein
MRRFLLTTCMSAALLCLCAPHGRAYAQDSVNVRTGTHDGYSRLVFDWAASVPYTATRSGNDSVDIEFKKTANMDSSGVDIKNAKTILGFEKLSTDGQNLKVRVKIPAGSDFRHFLVGNRVVLDVYGDVKAAAKTSPAPTPAAVAAPAAAPATKPAETVAEKKPDPAVAPVPAVPAATVAEAKTEALPQPVATPQSVLEPHNVTISSTNAVGIAAFERNGDLWVILDRSDITVPPQISGPQKDKFTPFEKVAIDGGVAYRTRIPDDASVTGEGGGLVWKLTIGGPESDARPIAPERSFAPGENIRGGTLFWPMQRVTRVIKFKDPDIGDTIMVGTVDAADQFAGPARDYVDFSALKTPVGIAIVPKTDDVELKPSGNGVSITRPGGLAITRTRELTQKIIEQKTTTPEVSATPIISTDAPMGDRMKRIFDFDRWMMGGLTALRENQQILLSGMADKDQTGRVQDLLMLAKMNLANDRGQEAVGFLNFALGELPEMADSPEFIALRGAAEALASKYEMAISDLNTPSLAGYGEMGYWRAYTLASLEDWQQAKAAMPQNFDVLLNYPRKIQERLGLKLAEIALRSGDATTADILLSRLEKDRKFLQPQTLAGLDYLLGEKARQAGQFAQATTLWKPLITGKDDLYRAKASLALTMLELQTKEITRDLAIDRLEGLRYHWRGDELESQVNFMLGKMYLEDGRYLKGFTILRDATVMSPNSDISREIASYMADSFKNIFLGKKIDELSPVDAVTVYEEFRELTPPGNEGNRLVQRLAERLVNADLLDRASKLLGHQVDYRLTGKESADVGLRLAAIDLLNGDAKDALAALDKSAATYAGIEPKTPEIIQKQKETEMLRARALSELDRVEEALRILNTFPPAPETNRLRADIAWNAGMWQDAAEALQDLILDESIDIARPLTTKQADLILNRSVALNLAGDRVALSSMRTKFGAAMEKTARSKMFDVVTRQRTGNLSSDRESIAALVSEVDMFKEFLDSYRASAEPSN